MQCHRKDQYLSGKVTDCIKEKENNFAYQINLGWRDWFRYATPLVSSNETFNIGPISVWHKCSFDIKTESCHFVIFSSHNVHRVLYHKGFVFCLNFKHVSYVCPNSS